MTNEGLAIRVIQAAKRASYYNAAEGDCWWQEREARRAANAEFTRLAEEAKAAGVYPEDELRGYLV